MDLNRIAEELFAKIRGRFPGVTIGDGDGNVTTEPTEARYFEFTFKENNEDNDKISIALDDEDGVTVMYNKAIAGSEVSKKSWYDFLRELRTFSKKRMLNFDVRNISKSNLEKRDYQYLATNSGDSNMNESKLYGTSKLSYQDVDNAKIVIQHTESVNTEVPTGRTRNIKNIYIESPEGERFKYPFKHLAGARAMARHVAEGGTTYDEFGGHIVDLSEELSKLRKFKNYMGRSKVMAESLAEYTGVINDRISTVKKRIEHLQKPNFYKEAYETFEKPVFEEIPEDVKENWIDQLTIRQFNEELKDVFPYIYKLIGEGTRAKELGPEDFMAEDETTEAAEKIACLGCDAVSTKAAWQKNNDTCPKCKKSSKGVAESSEDDGYADWKRDDDRDWRDQEKGMPEPEDDEDDVSIMKPRVMKAFAKKGIKPVSMEWGYYDGTVDVVDSKGREWNYEPIGNKIIPKDEVEVEEGQNTKRLWMQINKYEQQAKRTKSPIKKDHFMKMADELRDKLPTNEDDVEEGRGNLKKKFNKALFWGLTSPEKIKKRVRQMSDDDLKMLAKKPGEGDNPGSEWDLQKKLINQELKRRYGIKPGKNEAEAVDVDEVNKSPKDIANLLYGNDADSFGSKLKRFFSLNWIAPMDANKTAGINALRKAGFDDNEIKKIRDAAHVAFGEAIDKFGRAELGSRDDSNFSGWILDISHPAAGGSYADKKIIEYVKKRIIDILSKDIKKDNEKEGNNEAEAPADWNTTIEGIFNELMGQWAEEDEQVDEIDIDSLSRDLEKDLSRRNKPETELEKAVRQYKDLKAMIPDHPLPSDRNTLQHITNQLTKLEAYIEKLQAKKESEEEKEQQSPLSEFILSFYDRANGAFPKGETAVLTMVEKDYGEQFIEPAKQFIEQINQTFEQYNGGQTQEGMFDRFKKKPKDQGTPLPDEPATIQVGEYDVELEPDDNGYIGYSWHDSTGKEHYEESPVAPNGSDRGVATMEELVDVIKGEIQYVEDRRVRSSGNEEFDRIRHLAGL